MGSFSKSLEYSTASSLSNHSSQLRKPKSSLSTTTSWINGAGENKSAHESTKAVFFAMSSLPKKAISAMTTRITKRGIRLDHFLLGAVETPPETGKPSWVIAVLEPLWVENTPIKQNQSLCFLGRPVFPEKEKERSRKRRKQLEMGAVCGVQQRNITGFGAVFDGKEEMGLIKWFSLVRGEGRGWFFFSCKSTTRLKSGMRYEEYSICFCFGGEAIKTLVLLFDKRWKHCKDIGPTIQTSHVPDFLWFLG